MVLKQWRSRRQSIRELRRNSDETYKEYLRLCAEEKQFRQSQPPQYEDVLRGSGTSISSSQTGQTGRSAEGDSRPSNLMMVEERAR